MRSEFDYSSYNERECSIHNHAFYLGEQYQRSKMDELQKQKSLQELEINQIAHANQQWQLKCVELQKRVDAQTKHIEMALLAVKDIHKSAIDEFHDWDAINEKAPKLCEHLQNLSVAVGELEQALKGGEA